MHIHNKLCILLKQASPQWFYEKCVCKKCKKPSFVIKSRKEVVREVKRESKCQLLKNFHFQILLQAKCLCSITYNTCMYVFSFFEQFMYSDSSNPTECLSTYKFSGNCKVSLLFHCVNSPPPTTPPPPDQRATEKSTYDFSRVVQNLKPLSFSLLGYWKK